MCYRRLQRGSSGTSGESDPMARLSQAAEKHPLHLFIRKRRYSQLAPLCSRRPVCIFIHRINPGISHAHARASPRQALFDGRRARQRRRWSEAACRSNYRAGRGPVPQEEEAAAAASSSSGLQRLSSRRLGFTSQGKPLSHPGLCLDGRRPFDTM